MRTVLSLLALAGPAVAFVAPRLPSTPVTRSALRMSAIDTATDLAAGESGPLGFFDPLGLSNGKDEATIKKWREAELKHGRVAMLATIGYLTQERYHPLFGFNGKDMGQALYDFQEIQAAIPNFWFALLIIIGAIEARTISTGWQSPSDVPTGGIAGLRDDYITGDLGLDPFNVKEDPEKFMEYRTKELNNGRLAMIAILGMWLQEIASPQTILSEFFPNA